MASPRLSLAKQIKVVTIQESTSPYGQMDQPRLLVDFWHREIALAAWFDPEKEHLVVVCLNAKCRFKAYNLVSVGLANTVLIHAREVFRPAIALAASSIVLIHNHPSGDPAPSKNDIDASKEIKSAGKILKIECLDSITIGKPTPEYPEGYASLRQMGY